VLNIILNWTLVQRFGIIGIVYATVISLFISSFCYSTQITYKHYFKGISVREFYWNHFVYAVITLAAATVTYFVCGYIKFNGIQGLLVKALLCAVIPNVIFFMAYYYSKQYAEAVKWGLGKIKKKQWEKFLIPARNR